MKRFAQRSFSALAFAAFAGACGGHPVTIPDASDANEVAIDHIVVDTPITPDVQDVRADSGPDVVDVVDARDVADVVCSGAETVCNGSCVDTQTSTEHCGTCGHACPGGAHAAATCTAGTCDLQCDTGYADCDHDASNGCEVDLRTDGNHCGTCETACLLPHTANACVAGVCNRACDTGYADCDDNAANGCETATGGDVNNCGGCGTVCVTPHGTPICSGGTCGVDTCEPGRADCDHVASNGCEVELENDVANCGACGTMCPSAPHATASCAAHTCGIVCETGFADCDGNAANGCEVDLRADANNCGACGTVCSFPHATAMCSAGVCARLACDLGWVDCDADPLNGCEVNVNSDVLNCGACGRVCPTGNACVGRRCELPSTGTEGAFAPTGNVMLPSGIHNFTTIAIPSGVRVTVAGNGILDLRANGAVTIAGIIDASGGRGGDGLVNGDFGGGAGGGTGNGVAGANGAMMCGGGGNGGVGASGATGTSHAIHCGGTGGLYGGGGGGAYASAGGGGGGFAGGAGGAGAGAVMGGAGGSSMGAIGGAGSLMGGAGGIATGVYTGGDGLLAMGACGGAMNGFGGGGGSIGIVAANDLNAETSFQPGSAGGGGGGEMNDSTHATGASGGGGGGGGLIRIVSPVSITVTGSLVANGGAGGNAVQGAGAGGGGSGGLVDLAAPAMTVAASAVVSAAGGAGGSSVGCGTTGGAGGIGRIRLVVTPGMCNLLGTLTPALDNNCTPTPRATATGNVYITTY